MRTRPVFLIPLSALLAAVFLGATSVSAQVDFKDRFVGRWDVEKEKTKKYASEHKDGADFPDAFFDSLPKLTLEFLPSGVAKASMLKPPGDDLQTMEGDWKIVEEIDAAHAKLRIMMKVEGKEDAKDAVADFIDNDTLAIKIDEQPTLLFVRSVDEPKKKDAPSANEKNK